MPTDIRSRRQGIALVMVLVLIVMISLGAYTFTDMMLAQERATVMAGRRLQAKAAVASGVEYIKDYLVMLPEDQVGVGGHWDNPNYFKDVMVSSAETGATRFSIVSVAQDQYGEPTGWRYGLEDEGSKLNINTLALSDLFETDNGQEDSLDPEEQNADDGGDGGDDGGDQQDSGGGGDEPQPPDQGSGGAPRQADTGTQTPSTGNADVDPETGELLVDPRQNWLLQLPGMTEAIADSILDWIDADEEPRPAGAEAEVYGMAMGYEPPNGRIHSLDELLLVAGVTQELLYGADRNHNGVIDENEQEAAAAMGGTEGSMARGWSAYLTVASKDVIPQGEEPIDVNGDDLELLYDDLVAAGFDADFAAYVVAFRQGGPYQEPEIPEDPPADYEPPVIESIDGRLPNFEAEGSKEIGSVLDLIGGATEAEFPNDEGEMKKIIVASPYGADSNLATILPELMSGLSAGETSGEGRINTNHCSQATLAGIPDLDFATVQNIMLMQDPEGTSGDVNYSYPTWPLAVGAATIEEMKSMLPYVSGTGTIFRAQIIGYSDVPGVYARAEVVIDASGDVPQVLSWRDLSHLGAGFSVDDLMSQ